MRMTVSQQIRGESLEAGLLLCNMKQTPAEKAKSEIRQYESSTKADPNKNPLEWWKVHDCDFIVLSQLAKKYLCIRASSAPSEFLVPVDSQ